jgi:HSP20 family protein
MLNTLFTSDVRQTLDHFRRSVDQIFDNFYGYQTKPDSSEASTERAWTFSPTVEAGWNENHLNLRAILPGVAENDVRVSVQNNQLIIEGERKIPEGLEKNAFTHLRYGKFYSVLALPSGLDVDHVSCRLHNGVLDIQIPIAETSKPRQIQIQTAGQKAISA